MSSNPYAAPTAPVADVAVVADASQFLENGQSLSAGRGLNWVIDAWHLFKEQPIMWLLQLAAVAVLTILIGFIPILGQLIPSLLMPVLGAGIIYGAHQLAAGEPLTFDKLFAGFRQRAGSLMLLGVFMVLSTVVILLIGAGVGGFSYAVFTGGDVPSSMAGFFLAILLIMALFVPVYMAIWFAPALVMLNEFTVAQALKTSFAVCLKNIVPFLLYGIVMFALVFIASLPFGLGLIIALPILMLSAYTSYRDAFYLN